MPLTGKPRAGAGDGGVAPDTGDWGVGVAEPEGASDVEFASGR